MKRRIRTSLTSVLLLFAVLFTQNSLAQRPSRQPGDSFPCPGEWIPDCNPKLREVVKDVNRIKTRIAPNPATHYFTVHFSDVGTANAEIKVFDTNGTLRYEAYGSSCHPYRFGDGFKSGMYFVQVSVDGKQCTMKALKL